MRINDLQEKMELVEFEISNIENSIVSLSKEKSEINNNIGINSSFNNYGDKKYK